MSSSREFNLLSDQELHQRLLQHGYNMPVSINRSLLLKKLQSLETGGGGTRRNTLAPVSSGSGPSNPRHSLQPQPTIPTPKSSAAGEGSPSPNRKSRAGSGTGGSGGDRTSPIISPRNLTFCAIFFMIIGGTYYFMLRGGAGTGTIKQTVEAPGYVPPPKSSVPPPPPTMKTSFIPICGLDSADPAFCIKSELVKPSKRLFDLLKTELAERKKWKACGTEVDESISLGNANKLLYRLSNSIKAEVDSCFRSVLILAVENPSWGIKIENGDENEIFKSTELLNLDYETAKISCSETPTELIVILCSFWSALFSMTKMAFIFGFVACICSGCIILGVKYWGSCQKEQKEMFDIIGRIVDMLRNQYEQSSSTGVDPFLALNHIRDEIFTPEERLAKRTVWAKVMDYISTHESRIREEIQHISGEEYRVWRWVPKSSPAVASGKSLQSP